ncbi:MAG: DUF5114 domain-containing protein [Bacteroidales bacterium]|nr:DUF5114 domain-containing protein [Bacteroidales bacterium]
MKINHISRIIAAAVTVLAVTSCDKDGDMLTINTKDDVTIGTSSEEIVLDYNNLNALALTLNWDENGNLTLSNEAVALPDGVLTNSIEMSLSKDFSNSVSTPVDDGIYSYQFTVGELNSMMSRLGVEGGERAEVFVRIKTVIGKNIEPTYSNTLSLFVTPYKIDMSVAYVLNKSQEMTSRTLLSPTENGIYEGFAGVNGWENWYMKDALGVIWGNSATAGTFAVSSLALEDKIYNLWYPGTAGCYYTIVNTVELWWSALLIPELTVSGDINGVMEFDRKTSEWKMTVDTKAGSKNITISGTGTLYDISTGDKNSSINKPVALTGTADNLAYSESASTVAVNVTASGSQVMKLTMVTPLQWAISFEAGSEEPEEPASPLLYLSGHDDAVSGSWHFNNYLRLYNSEEKAYAGGCYFDSKWGYKLYKEAGNWDESWGFGGEGDTMGGKLKYGAKTNIPAPEAGLYILNVGLNGLTYEVTPVSTVCYSGLNDDWSKTPMTASETPGVYTAVVEKSANTPWGVKILINESWTVCFGGGNGELLYGHDGFDGDNELANGSYLLTVDLINSTYSYSNI